MWPDFRVLEDCQKGNHTDCPEWSEEKTVGCTCDCHSEDATDYENEEEDQ